MRHMRRNGSVNTVSIVYGRNFGEGNKSMQARITIYFATAIPVVSANYGSV